MRPSVRPLTLSDMNISEISWPIIGKYYLKHYWGRGLAALGFGPDRIRTLVSMATDSFHRVIMGKSCEHSSSSIFHWIFFILANNKDSNISLDGLEIRQYWTRVCEVSYPRTSEKISLDLKWEKCCEQSKLSFLNGSSSFLKITRATIKA